MSGQGPNFSYVSSQSLYKHFSTDRNLFWWPVLLTFTSIPCTFQQFYHTLSKIFLMWETFTVRHALQTCSEVILKSVHNHFLLHLRLLLEPLRSRFGQFSISSYTYQYSSKTKTRQNGFVMALERTADNIKETTQTIWETIWVSFISNLFILKTEFRTCFVYSHVFSNKTQII